ncbi:MAG TPA: aldehyde dehydrogenase family protein [Mycobacterium sp.]|jgi:acyl-CoA reductase-like NAD-dependent aldehyde dehydrogenase|nr:aldehyde dehydrogenase family protein [Mycobacterium sp.]
MSSTVTDVKAYQWYAGGQWRDVANGQMFDDFEPYTGNLCARVADCGAEQARLAIAAAHEAFGAWADTPPVQKARLLCEAAEIVRRRGPEVAEILARETAGSNFFWHLKDPAGTTRRRSHANRIAPWAFGHRRGPRTVSACGAANPMITHIWGTDFEPPLVAAAEQKTTGTAARL